MREGHRDASAGDDAFSADFIASEEDEAISGQTASGLAPEILADEEDTGEHARGIRRTTDGRPKLTRGAHRHHKYSLDAKWNALLLLWTYQEDGSRVQPFQDAADDANIHISLLSKWNKSSAEILKAASKADTLRIFGRRKGQSKQLFRTRSRPAFDARSRDQVFLFFIEVLVLVIMIMV